MKIMSHFRVDLLFSLRKEKSKQKRNELLKIYFDPIILSWGFYEKKKVSKKRNELLKIYFDPIILSWDFFRKEK